MEIKVQEIPCEGLSLSCEEDPSELGLDKDEISVEGKIRVRLKAVKHNENNVYIRGAIEAEILSECSRCLIQYVDPIRSDFHIEYVPKPQVLPDEELALSREELEINYYQGDQIEINDEIRSQLFLGVPMRSLCEPDCRGLCPHCGENLNFKRCSCSAELPDARWAKLKNLLNQ